MNQNDDDPLDTVGFKFSLLDPLTYQRIQVPVRSVHCSHIKCFDLRTFLEMYADKETKVCPICSGNIYLKDLILDSYVKSILDNTKEDEEDVDLETNGDWKPSTVHDMTPDNCDSDLSESASDPSQPILPQAGDPLAQLPELVMRYLQQTNLDIPYIIDYPNIYDDIQQSRPADVLPQYPNHGLQLPSSQPTFQNTLEPPSPSIIDLVDDNDTSDSPPQRSHPVNDQIIDLLE